MRRAFAVVLMGVALTLLSARPASAQYSWFKWINELSGPGKFELNGTTVTFGCVKRRPTQTGEKAQYVKAEVGAPYMQLFCDKGPDWRRVERFMGVTFAVGDGTNPLEYPSTVEKLERVKGQLYLGTGGFRLLKGIIDVGASGGFMRFAGAREDGRDLWLTTYLVEPYIAVRPFALLPDRTQDSKPDSRWDFWKDHLARAVEFNAALIIFPQGFRLSDFGAIGGADLSSDVETIVRWGFRATFVF